jgi:hypothetical protein
MRISSSANLEYLKLYATHEIGHTFGLNNCGSCGSTSIMSNGPSTSAPTICDIAKIGKIYCPIPTPSPTPTPYVCPYPANNFQYPENQGCPAGRVNDGFGCCIIARGTCNGEPDWGQYPTTGCASGFVASGGTCTRSNAFVNQCNRWSSYDDSSCGCVGACLGDSCSPVLIDIIGNGFGLTDALNGVDFDVDGNGTSERRAWTDVNSDDAWLVLDRNGNGTIDGGKEMFGSVMSQPPPPDGIEFNGFNALSQYDEAGFGGNGDGQIDNRDAVFSQLRLWQDANHNGISEPSELHTLASLDIAAINLKYKESKRVDQYGNLFKYRSKVLDAKGAQVGRWAWDVFLIRQ